MSKEKQYNKGQIFKVSGFWKNDKAEFNNYLIFEYDNVPNGYEDEDIFYYGLSEKDLKNSCENDSLEFVITNYKSIVL